MQNAEDGYKLWLRYEAPRDAARLAEWRTRLAEIAIAGDSPTLQAAKDELELGLTELLGKTPRFVRHPSGAGTLLVGTPAGSPAIAGLNLRAELAAVGAEGFVLKHLAAGHGARSATIPKRPPRTGNGSLTVIAANTDVGVLYGTFAFLRHLQTAQQTTRQTTQQTTRRPLAALDVSSAPRLKLRLLNHWDNLDGTVERGYAGSSLWDWHKLPNYVSPQYRDYARANASIGINGVVLTNVNANALVLTGEYLPKVAALAKVMRPYGTRVYLTARFSAPIELGKLKTADPLNAAVIAWWGQKCREIVSAIPDFGGFLVKANSEGQPGPQDYGRTHADGANLLADALAGAAAATGGEPGLVIWRAFVYREAAAEDRAKQAYADLAPLDGKFRANALVQVKNGPIDFQPREPFHPLFGAMPRTSLVAEFQITQEYLGCATHLVYLGPLFKETLDADTHARGAGWPVSRLLTGMAGVANIGTERNWCGHPFAAANWFAFGRLAWDPGLDADDIADDWLRLTFTDEPRFIAAVKPMMLGSREAAVNYMTPLGLHHLMAKDHHYGPGPWVDSGRADWTSVYYHRADAAGIGFDRSPTGSNAVAQYHPPWPSIFGDARACPESLLLWFHHLPWDHPLKSGRPLWDELCLRYQAGVDAVRSMRATWKGVAGAVDGGRFEHVKQLLAIQEQEAKWWRDACLLYFQTFSRRPFPAGCEKPAGRLEDYRMIKHSFVPGIHHRDK